MALCIRRLCPRYSAGAPPPSPLHLVMLHHQVSAGCAPTLCRPPPLTFALYLSSLPYDMWADGQEDTTLSVELVESLFNSASHSAESLLAHTMPQKPQFSV